jgi:hypothetical protein
MLLQRTNTLDRSCWHTVPNSKVPCVLAMIAVLQVSEIALNVLLPLCLLQPAKVRELADTIYVSGRFRSDERYSTDDVARLALELYMSAATQGDVGAQKAVGFCHDKGHGVAPDYSEAFTWCVSLRAFFLAVSES